MSKLKSLIFIPTYNEKENIEVLYREIREQGVSSDILIMDDNSPDGTSDLVKTISKGDDRVFAKYRSGKLGVGSAHLDGIQYAYERGYSILITMDCDFTHQPKDIPRFLKLSEDYDLIIGSRHLQEDSLENWSLHRKCLTCLGHLLTKTLLNIPYDATNAFRLYRLDRIDPEVFSLVNSQGYSFFLESLFFLVNHLDLKIKEIPIRLPARTYGHSKMKLKDIIDSLLKILLLYKKR
jgi:dolichol-phosphate mannosyltransferase